MGKWTLGNRLALSWLRDANTLMHKQGGRCAGVPVRVLVWCQEVEGGFQGSGPSIFCVHPVPETLVFHIIGLIILLNKRIGAEIL